MPETILVLRTPSGISGDMFLAGLSRLAGLDQAGLDELCASLNVADLAHCAALEHPGGSRAWPAGASPSPCPTATTIATSRTWPPSSRPAA